MDGKKNNVYVNPNFTKSNYKLHELIPSTKVHLNPAFSPNTSITPDVRTKLNIHVNPNFYRHANTIETTTSPLSFSSIQQSELEKDTFKCNDKFLPVSDTSVSKSRYKFTRNISGSSKTICVTTTQQQDINIRDSGCSSSNAPNRNIIKYNRYQFTRKNNDNVTNLHAELPNKSSNRTVALSKYKSVRISDVKKNLETFTKHKEAKQTRLTKNTTSKKFELGKRFKLDKRKLVAGKPSLLKNCASVSTRKFIAAKYKLNKSSKPNKYKKNNKFKKCNIPCPLFKKFGKCLRLERDICNYLHDKKHVAICKKFIKGICFDKDCLLSHEVTSKKMPTCAFYLRGLCAKENCPYSHVKLSDNIGLCADFVNGFCEKGDSCSKKHLSVAKKNTRNTRSKVRNDKVSNRLTKPENTDQTHSRNSEEKPMNDTECSTTSDVRYFKDSTNKEQVVCEIKPTRCKLGILPSFIKLL